MRERGERGEVEGLEGDIDRDLTQGRDWAMDNVCGIPNSTRGKK